MKILIVDNNINPEDWGAEGICRLARLAQSATIHVRRAPHEDLPSHLLSYDRVILSGSKTSALADAPWIDKLSELIMEVIHLGKPFLGVCYGHQLLARVLGGKNSVRKADFGEFGWTKIHISGPSPLFEGMPKEFYSFSSHIDEIAELPRGLKKLASSDICQVQACQLENKPVFGIQFHPEKNNLEAKKYFAEKRKTDPQASLMHSNHSDLLYNPNIGEKLFKNFLTL